MSRPDVRRSNPFSLPTLSSLADDILPETAAVPRRPALRITRVGLEGEAATRAEWEAFGQTLRDIEGGVQWAIGDWIMQGERQWGETYAAAVENLGFDETTLRDYVYVASNVHLSLRNDNLSWSHHKAVAHLHDELQGMWLNMAQQGGWSVAVLRREIAAAAGTLPAPKSAVDKTLTFGERLERQAADLPRHERAQIADELERVAARLRSMG